MTAPYRARLRYLRRITVWTLVLFVAAGFLMVSLELVWHRTEPLPTLVVLGVCAVVSAAVAGHFMIASVAVGGPPPMTRPVRIALGCAAAGALVPPVVAAPVYSAEQGSPAPWLLFAAVVTSAVMAGSGLPRWPTAVVGTALTTASAALGAALAGRVVAEAALVAAVAGAVCGVTVAAQLWFWEVAEQVDRARQVEGEVAVAGERLRFAAELHDIQGHSLQVIALKSELAARLVATDPGRAVAEMREVETLAREALRDTREVAHGYRPVSLTTEITNATRVLTAAGVDCVTTQDDDLPALASAAERLLGLVVREATTNVIRHSRAAAAEMTLSSFPTGVRLVLSNDAALAPAPAGGGGLSGLAERFAAAGGSLTWRQRGDTFTVTAEVAAR